MLKPNPEDSSERNGPLIVPSASDNEANSFSSPSLTSFINPTDFPTDADPAPVYEVIFHNAALMKLLNLDSPEELDGFINKPLFVNTEMESLMMSLATAVQSKFSDVILSQVYALAQPSE